MTISGRKSSWLFLRHDITSHGDQRRRSGRLNHLGGCGGRSRRPGQNTDGKSGYSFANARP
jgi:hypothetical protein